MADPKADTQDQLDRMCKQMKKEAEDRAEQIIADGKSRQQTEQNKLRDVGVQALETKYEKLREQEFIRMRTDRSRAINNARISIQVNRNDLVESLKSEVCKQTAAFTKDKKKYAEYLKLIIIQGLIKFIEPEVYVRCRAQDNELVEGVLSSCETEYTEFLAKHGIPGKVTKLTVLTEKPLTEKETKLGGVILICHTGQIVFDNTFEQRVDLAMNGSLPAIRVGLFPNLKDIDFSN